MTLLVDDGIEGAVDGLADLGAGHPVVPVVLLVWVEGLLQFHVFIHVDDGHDLAHFLRGVGPGPVEGEAVVEADLAKVVGAGVDGEVGDFQVLVDPLLAFLADGEIAAELDLLAADGEFEGPHSMGTGTRGIQAVTVFSLDRGQ